MQSSKASCRTARKLQNESESTRDLQSLLHFIICKPWFFAIVTENRATAEEVPMYSCNNLNSNTDNLTAKDIEVLIY